MKQHDRRAPLSTRRKLASPKRHHKYANSTLTRGFQTATDTPVIREEGAPAVPPPPPGREGAVGMGNGPAILSKFMVSSFKMSVLDKARLYLIRFDSSVTTS